MKTRWAVLWTSFVLATGVDLAMPPSASASPVWVGGTLAYNSYNMSDLNDLIDAINDEIYPFEMEELNGGLAFGLQLGIEPTAGRRVYVAYERLSGTSDVADHSGEIEIQVPANHLVVGAEYDLPSASTTSRLGIGGAVGLVSASGGSKIRITGEGGASADYEGSALAVQGYVYGSFRPGNSNFAISPQVGYRLANIGDPEIDNESAIFDLDYSGVIVRVALRLGRAPSN